MAGKGYRSLGTNMSTAEQIAGFCYLPFYVILLALGLEYLNVLLDLRLTALQINGCYFVLNALAVGVIFHRFLLQSFRSIRFWELIQALILGFVLYYVGNYLFSKIIDLLGISITNFNDQAVQELAEQSRPVMIVCSVLLAPLVEETLVRGLLFGTLHRTNRYLAYGVTIVFFAGLHVWQYLPVATPTQVLLAALQYIPAGIALGWTYEKAGTIWAPVALHMVINAIAFGMMQFL